MAKNINLSIIIPVFNAQEWMEPTIRCVEQAVAKSLFTAEIIVVDDGSTDDTLARVKAIKPASPRLTLRVISQENKGRYLARKAGIAAASHDVILFIDSRVFIDEDALAYLYPKILLDMQQVWNGHVYIDKKGNPFARFWDAIVCIAWRRYFGQPKEMSYSLKDFDYYPKGTGCFFVPKKIWEEALSDFENQHGQPDKFSSDDTLIIRYIAEKHRIHLGPRFSCLYHGRSTLQSFLKHAYFRGQFFVDGFLKPGNRYFLPLLLFLGLTASVPIALIIAPLLTLQILFTSIVAGIMGLFFGSLLFRVIWQDALSLASLAPFFAVVYGAGIWRAVLRKSGIWK